MKTIEFVQIKAMRVNSVLFLLPYRVIFFVYFMTWLPLCLQQKVGTLGVLFANTNACTPRRSRHHGVGSSSTASTREGAASSR